MLHPCPDTHDQALRHAVAVAREPGGVEVCGEHGAAVCLGDQAPAALALVDSALQHSDAVSSSWTARERSELRLRPPLVGLQQGDEQHK
eukprot:COSAG06_NODE_628_length_13649_cov_20.848930_5_plen_89_part_00